MNKRTVVLYETEDGGSDRVILATSEPAVLNAVQHALEKCLGSPSPSGPARKPALRAVTVVAPPSSVKTKGEP
jgi:hypothetical protein